MTTFSALPILVELQRAQSLSSQIAILRQLKNETIGHDQRKEALVRGGIIPILADILKSRQPIGKKYAEQDSSEPKEEKEREVACLQAIIVIGSLVQGEFFFFFFYYWSCIAYFSRLIFPEADFDDN